MDFQTPLQSSRSYLQPNNTLRTFDDGNKPSSASLASVISTFVPTWLTAVLFLAIFAGIRNRYPKIYSPRTYIGSIPEKDRTPSQSRGFFAWAHTLRVVPDKFVLYHHSLDAYLYLRFLRSVIFICFIGGLLTWPILMPINATGGGKATQLDRISIGNVVKPKFLYAHAVVAWVFFGFVMFLVARERLWLIGLRQAWNLSKPNAKRLSSRTVLFLGAPEQALNEENLHKFFGDDATRLWPVTKADHLESLVSDRNKKAEQLEAAEIKLIHNADKKGRKGNRNSNSRGDNEVSFNSLTDSVKVALRPTHRLKTKPVGKQVDSIQWFREQTKEKESEVEKARESYTVPESRGAASVFVEFKTQAAAQRAYQQVTSSHALSLNPRFTGVLPNEVIWKNLTVLPAVRVSQEYTAHAIVAATIIFYSIPQGFIATISNVNYLADTFSWLRWLKNLPDPVLGLLTGLVPPLLTSLLSKYIPNIFRYIAKKFGEPTNTSAELKVQKWFFIFQVIQVFIVTSIASGTTAAFGSEILKDPSSIPTILAQKLPSAANFYLTYFILQGTTNSADNMLNYSDLLQWLAFDKAFDKTPRQKYNRYTSLKGMAWGKVYSKMVNLLVIAIAYSCVAPLVLGFAAIGISFYYVSYRYQLLFTVQAKIDTKGHAYTIALQHLLTGIYICELALIGIFGLKKATGPSIMLAVLFVCTIFYNAVMNRYLEPLERFLPADLAAQSEDVDEQAPLLSAAEEGQHLSHPHSHIQHLGQEARLPSKVVDPLARFFEPHIFASHKAMASWLRDGDFDEDDVPEYSKEDQDKAYLNPAFTSKTPLIWLAKDRTGASKNEIRENEEAGLRATDEGAWIDEKGRLRWAEHDFGEVPAFQRSVKY